MSHHTIEDLPARTSLYYKTLFFFGKYRRYTITQFGFSFPTETLLQTFLPQFVSQFPKITYAKTHPLQN